MKKHKWHFMKKNLLQLLAAFISAAALISCNGFGNKVTFDDTNGEVYYKGAGVTEADARAVGKFLNENNYFQKDGQTRSVQITKEDGRIKARFVINRKAMDTLAGADKDFELIGAAMSKEIFNNMPVDVICTDSYFRDFKTIPFAPSQLPAVSLSEELQQMDQKEYRGNTLYTSKNMLPAKTDSIYNYLVSSGFFTNDGAVDLIMSLQQNGIYLVKFPSKASAGDADGLQKIDDFGREMKQSVFAADSMQLEVLGEHMDSVKTFAY